MYPGGVCEIEQLVYNQIMGRTLPSIAQEWYELQRGFKVFRGALRCTDQLALDELFIEARKHLAPAAYAANLLPMETFMVAMLLEEHKEVIRLRGELHELRKCIDRR